MVARLYQGLGLPAHPDFFHQGICQEVKGLSDNNC